MSSSKMDPRRPDKIVPFHMPSNVPPSSDYAGNLAVAVGMGGIMVRNSFKAFPWIAAFFGASSMFNSRKTKRDDQVGFSGAILGLVSLCTYYLNVYMMHKRAMDNAA
ncbi:hypothetical protein K492DRAFT_211027 [Lichtheimia hyalospora FSU 10163]|nr:hypothetical protein K492DRAFT_211027 [Lichtheimia hyalospora FSU 10163]